MVYMAADNNLDISAPLDVQEMLDIGSTANVTVLVQFDSRTTPTRRYRIDKGQLVLLQDLGEQNMASPDTLRDFIQYGVTSHPAGHYALILSSHGDGWQSGVDGVYKRVQSILEDWNNTNVKTSPLPNFAVAAGIRAAGTLTGVKLDILGVDACIMATLEAAYEFRDSADILIASQDLVQGQGWDYRDLLGRLTAQPAMNPRELATAIVDSYRSFSESTAWGYGNQTISALTLGSGIEAVAKEVDALSMRVKAFLDDPTTRDAAVQMITNARLNTQQLSPPTHVDLYDFSTKLEPGASMTPLQTALKTITIAEYHGSKRPNAHGLNIVFYDLPATVASSVYGFDYVNYDPTTRKGSHSSFINDFNWDEMMSDYFTSKYPEYFR